MYSLKVVLKGLTPLRYNAYREDNNTTKRSGARTEEELLEQAEQSTYKDKGGYFVPQRAIKKALDEAAKRIKQGRGSAKKDIQAIVVFRDEKIYCQGKMKAVPEWGTVRIPPRTGALVKKAWMQLPAWKLAFTIDILDETFRPEIIKDAFEKAGMYSGILDNRPNLGGSCGRFEVESVTRVR